MPKKIDTAGLKHFKGKENAMIAGKPESTNTATVAHAVGEYFYWKGVLHIVTAAIAVGGTIQTNTNVKPAVLADDVGALKTAITNNVMRVLPSKNLYNPTLNQSGRMYLVAVGTKQTTTTSTTQVYQKMQVEVGKSYAVSGVSKVALTDADDIVIENIEAVNTNLVIQSVPSGVTYLWIETNTTLATTGTQVEYGTVITSYEPFGNSSSVGYGDTKVFDLDFPFDELENAPSDIDSLNDDVADLKTATEVDGFFTDVSGFNGVTTYTGYVDNNGGFVSATSGWIRTDYIATAERAPIIASLKGYLTNPIIAYYNAEKQYLGSISILSNSQLVVNVNDYVPSGVAYAVFVSQTDYDGRSFTIGTPANLAESIDAMASDLYSFKGIKVFCMGDSLTIGRDGLGNILSHNYPYYMQQTMLKECIIDNHGVVGSTTVTYWNNVIQDLTIDNTIDIVLMMWGTNGGLVSNTLATDVEPYDSYEDYADTGVGDYCKIIEYVMEQTQNKAQIILLTPPYNGNTSINDRVINAQSVVKAIAERYNLPFIDMFKSGINKWNTATYMPDDSVHFSEDGYKWIGTYIGSCINALTAKRNF